MPEVTVHTPSVGTCAYFTFKEPISTYIRNKYNLSSANQKLKVISVITMMDTIRQDFRDPYTDLYEVAGISEVDYKQDLIDRISLISFSYLDDNSIESYIRVPINYIESISSIADIDYYNRVIVLDLNRLPFSVDTIILHEELKDYIQARIGIRPQIKEVSIGAAELVSPQEHESRETVRKNSVTVYKTAYTELEELRLRYTQLVNRLKELKISLG